MGRTSDVVLMKKKTRMLSVGVRWEGRTMENF